MTAQTRDLLFEIGCEELPASFVRGALEALPDIAARALKDLRLSHGTIVARGTPRRLAMTVHELCTTQPDLKQDVVGPPVRAAFRDGEPTKAAEAFAKKLGCAVAELRTVETAKGEYVAGTKQERGRPAQELLPEALAAIAKALPFRKSMRWGTGSVLFGRPVRWLLALLGGEVVPAQFAGATAGRTTYGHRFLHPGPIEVAEPAGYVDALRQAHVVVDPSERSEQMRERLLQAAQEVGGTLIEDDFLQAENLSLVEEPQVVAGRFEEEFLELPESVVLEVARGHQRYFCLRGSDGRLLPRYLAVVNTAERPEAIQLGNDRVMRARLSDARFFYREDLKRELAERRSELGAIVFQERLGTVLDKTERCEVLGRRLGALLGLPEADVEAAAEGIGLAKCDLVTLMVGEFPELQGWVGRAYAQQQGVAGPVADVIRDHYAPRGAGDQTAPSDAAALAAMADRIDTLVGCFGIGLSPTGAADPYGLRRACLGTLRTLLNRGLDLQLPDALAAAYEGYAKVSLDLSADELTDKLGTFFRDRLRGLLTDGIAPDAVDAALAVAAGRPLDARARAQAIMGLDPQVRAQVGEVFKRATNIAKEAPAGEPVAPETVVGEVAEAERALFDGFRDMRDRLLERQNQGAYAAAFEILTELTPLLARYFEDVFVMDDDPKVRKNRLRLMRAISETCSMLARLELLGGQAGG